MARCNLPAGERTAILHNSERWGPEADDLDRCRDFFDQFLFIEIPYWDRRKRIVTCSYCEQASCMSREDARSIFSLRHRDAANCPMCGHSVTVQMLGRLGKGGKLYQTAAVSFINVSPEGEVYMESGIAFDDFTNEYGFEAQMPRMEISFIGKKRYYFRPGAVMGWKRVIGYPAQRELFGVGGWEETANITEPFSRNPLYGFDGYGYVVGFERLRDSLMKYSQIDRYYSEYHKMDIYEEINPLRLVPQYLAEYALHPQIEMAVKLGMAEAVGELVRDGKKNARDINWNAKDPAGFVRLGKADAKKFYEDPSLEGLRWVHLAQRCEMSLEAAQRIAEKIGIPQERMLKLCGKYSVGLEKLATRYKDKLHAEMWADYIEAAELLGYDLSRQDVLLPKYEQLRQKHDEAAANRRIIDDDKKSEKYREGRRKQLEKKYGFCMDGLKIVVPEGIADIVNEGKVLHICVGGYAHRHIDGKTTILFLRHERRPERSYICIEVDDDGRIRQIHGYGNEWNGSKHLPSPSLRYKGWLDTWQGWIQDGSPRDRSGKPIIRERKTA